MPQKVDRRGSSPYSTGGGGVLLEQEVAAAALASLLLAQPVEGLGDEFTPTSVNLQQEAHSAVDDVIIRGVTVGSERDLRVACRRNPVLGKSSDKSVKLFADFVHVLLDASAQILSGTLRLGLAIEGPSGPAKELATLAEVARRQLSREGFDAAVNAPGAYNARVRTRLTNIYDLVDAALKYLDRPGDPKDPSWMLLRALFVIETQFEGDVAPSRSAVIARLQALTGDAARAADLWRKLLEIASQSAIRAGAYTRAMLRSELRPFGLLGASPDFAVARPQIELLESELRRRTRGYLPTSGSGPGFTLDRSELRNELISRVASVPPSGGLVVHGEPDVGKSFVALEAIDAIRASGGVALAMSLRDLPDAAISLKGELGLGPTDLLAAAPSAPVSVLLLDGVEAIQERQSESLGALLDAAATVGMTTVLVVRDDAIGAVRKAVMSRGHGAFDEVSVAPLADREVRDVVKAIPELVRLAADPRASWLMRRLGLVELLLQAAEHHGLPASLTSEAEVFASVWHGLVRQDERTVSGVTPDDRDAALAEVARSLLAGTPPATHGAALASLRSDGILLSRGRTATWHAGERFASDVLRDFATARLLVRESLAILSQSGAPRWTVRAARVYAQAQLAYAAGGAGNSIATRWMELRQAFTELSQTHGARWSEVLWEATLTAGWADRVLAELTPHLLADAALLNGALRCVELRFATAGASDPVVGAPLVEWVTRQGLLRTESFYDETSPARLVLYFLRGLARSELRGEDVAPYRALRAEVREELLLVDPYGRHQGWLECLGLLAADSSDTTRAALSGLAQESPHMLAAVVESLDAATTLASHDAALLAELTQAYYIEEPKGEAWIGSFDDEGIRHHQGGGWGVPLAAWYRGPFLPLLRADPRRGLRVLNRMLDRGARDRTAILGALTRGLGSDVESAQEDRGLELDLLGLERRVYAGDAHVWSWYRGSGVGPYPCMSALFALEMFMDELVQAGWQPAGIAKWVLKDATSLASAGLVYGFLVRHLESVTSELDGYLEVPGVWKLEFGRALSEGALHVQGPDQENVVGRERRRWTPREVASHLVISAAQRDDKAALARLKNLGHQLVNSAGGLNAPAAVRLWASHLDWDAYIVTEREGQVILEVRAPEEVQDDLRQAQQRSSSVNAMYALINRYRPRRATPYRLTLAPLPDAVQLTADYETARRLVTEREGEQGEIDQLGMALSGVASAVLDATSRGLDVPEGSLEWSLTVLVESATRSTDAGYGGEHSVFPDGADRKAALALPLALPIRSQSESAAGTPLNLGAAEQRIEKALIAGATSAVFEVRQTAAEGLCTVLDHTCAQPPDGHCWHETAWSAIEAAARAVSIGDRREDGRRKPDALSGDLSKALSARSTRDLMLPHLIPPTICVLVAARSNTCISTRAAALQGAMLHAYARVARLWATKNYEWSAEQHAALASALLSGEGPSAAQAVLELAHELRSSTRALGEFLRALVTVATYEATKTPSVAAAWPALMELGLSELRGNQVRKDRFDRDVLLRNLVPRPILFSSLVDADTVLKSAEGNWLGMNAVVAGIDEWLRAARGRDWCVDALVGFLRAQTVNDQVDLGLTWIRRLIVDKDGSALTSGFLLVEWLRALRDSGALGASAWNDFRPIVDALALSGFSGARELQQRDE